MVLWELMALTSLLLRARRPPAGARRPARGPVVRGDDPLRRGRDPPRARPPRGPRRRPVFAAIARMPRTSRRRCAARLPARPGRLRLEGRRRALHVWLPRAHPEAPSPVSALMSGAMVNLGVYGIIRVGDDLLGGGAVVVAGGAGARRAPRHSSARSTPRQHRPETPAGLLDDRQHRPRPDRRRRRRALFDATGHPRWPSLALVAALFHLSTTPLQGLPFSRRRVRPAGDRHPRPRPARRPRAPHAARAAASS